MAGTPVVTVAAGGLAVTETTLGAPVSEATPKFGIAVTKVAAGGLPVNYGAAAVSAEAAQFFSRVADPGAARKTVYSTLIDGLVSDGVWAKLDVLCMLAAANSATALTNLKSASFNPTAVAAPTFTADRGFTGNGTSSYLNSNFNPATAGGQYTLNSATLGSYIRSTNAAGANVALIACFDGSNFAQFSGTAAALFGSVCLINNATASSDLASRAAGLFIVSRSASNLTKVYVNGVASSMSDPAAASVAVPNANLFVSARNFGGGDLFSPLQCAAYVIGSGLNDAQALALTTRIDDYMTAVGADVAFIRRRPAIPEMPK